MSENKEIAQIVADWRADWQHVAKNRDTQFVGFAALLIQEIDEQFGAVTDWAEKYDIDDKEKIGHELATRWVTVISHRAYDFMVHVVGHSMEYLDECGREIPGSMTTRVAASMPDMDRWPEEMSK